MTSDGGLPWLAEAEKELALCSAFARYLTDGRADPSRSRHSLEMLVRRVFQLACGEEDQDDADALRADPLFTPVCGQLPESGHDLANRPTLSRLDNCVDRRICKRLALALVTLYLRQREHDGPRRGFSATATAPMTRRTATGRAPATRATTASICPIPSWSSTVARRTSSLPSCAPAPSTQTAPPCSSWAGWSVPSEHAGPTSRSSCAPTAASPFRASTGSARGTG
ncbi:MAG: transposase [Chloroflexi bacterium]|nr:transposase [Chloroflexota bacterium]